MDGGRPSVPSQDVEGSGTRHGSNLSTLAALNTARTCGISVQPSLFGTELERLVLDNLGLSGLCLL